ncbi:MAG: hypothetical protein IJV56_09345 [Neisseriaceae bacterium]|nr:hypothetical protein [Neisseriaceae bacterium]
MSDLMRIFRLPERLNSGVLYYKNAFAGCLKKSLLEKTERLYENIGFF